MCGSGTMAAAALCLGLNACRPFLPAALTLLAASFHFKHCLSYTYPL